MQRWALFAVSVLSCVNSISAKMCKPLNSTVFRSCIDANFTHTIDSLASDYYVEKYSKMINHIRDKLGECSPYSDTLLCSLYVPRCKEEKTAPFLPCRRVCREFVYGCQDKLLKQGLSWLISLCHILPESGADSGQCFEPEGFTPTHANEPFIKSCAVEAAVSDQCSGYKTFWNAAFQREIRANVSIRIKTLLGEQRNCSSKKALEKLVCAKYAPPCLGKGPAAATPGALCMSRCFSLLDDCPSALKPEKNLDLHSYCASTAEGTTKDGYFCQYNQWPSARHWPEGSWVKRLRSNFSKALVAALVLVPILAVVGICVAVMIRRKMSRDGYERHSTAYDAGADTVTFS